MKKIISLLIVSIFLTINFTTSSFAWNDLVSNNEKTTIDIFVKKYVTKITTKYTTWQIVIKFVNIIKKIDILKEQFKKRTNLSNKEKILQILSIIKIEIKFYLANLKSSELSDDMKTKLGEIGIYKSDIADSIFLENWAEVYKHWNRNIGTKNVIYYIRLLDNDLDNIDSDKNEVYIKKAIFKNGEFKEGSNTFVAKLWNFTNSDLYSLRHDFQDVPNCYDAFREYKWTKYEWIADSMLYVSDSYEELISKIKKWKKRSTMLNLEWNMCPQWNQVNKMRWLRFEADQSLIDFLEDDLKNTLKKLK